MCIHSIEALVLFSQRATNKLFWVDCASKSVVCLIGIIFLCGKCTKKKDPKTSTGAIALIVAKLVLLGCFRLYSVCNNSPVSWRDLLFLRISFMSRTLSFFTKTPHLYFSFKPMILLLKGRQTWASSQWVFRRGPDGVSTFKTRWAESCFCLFVAHFMFQSVTGVLSHFI